MKAKYVGTKEGLKPQRGLAGCLCSVGYWKPDPVTAFGMELQTVGMQLLRNPASKQAKKSKAGFC